MSEINKDDVVKSINRILHDFHGIEISDDTELDSDFNRLGIGYLGELEIIMELESELDISIDDDLWENVSSVNELAELVVKLHD